MARIVSVIVPVYNDEEYLLDCVGSILNQTYQNTNFRKGYEAKNQIRLRRERLWMLREQCAMSFQEITLSN